MAPLSPLQRYRLSYQPSLPSILKHLTSLHPVPQTPSSSLPRESALKDLFPQTAAQPFLAFQQGQEKPSNPLRVGVVLSGGQAPGGHNVISGLYDALKKIHPQSELIGFYDGPNGIIKNKTLAITDEILAVYRNQGGFDLLGSSRTKIESPEQFDAAEKTIKALNLDGLVIVGGDDSNTNAAFLAEYFKRKGMNTRVVGVPKTIDGDLKNEFIDISFGFDTACKVYSEAIGNLLKDALSAKKYYFFIKLMGRSASHIVLECALQTHPNLAIISEEVEGEKQTLADIVQQIVRMIVARADQGKNYGAVLIPEGLIEFIPEFKQMLRELNHLLAADPTLAHLREQERHHKERVHSIASHLSEASSHCLLGLPESIQKQLLLDRDPHGNVQVSKIETERLLIDLVEKELNRLKQEGKYKGKFSSQPLFFGYEGRSGLPSNFDCQYCYALGHTAALLILNGATGYMSGIGNLTQPVSDWEVAGIPIYSLLHQETREGKKKAVIQKALVDLEGAPFAQFCQQRAHWLLNDDYCCPGPIQFDGPSELTDKPPLTLSYEKSAIAYK
ncbi:diphosphate--fructose-6-phosphate 1-phosphotransferase [Candidatus Protochlamydia phocaeensis]|uniref:diphosphate--fructose-6-phosphate 1-phosphotransferase n=1 Tax=Candidatus Protochlamydia phocaeensis TaxID=1414722 RepID=UPI00083848C2|nr:diphosphate--fructose-6-phosphate 1-phosphotransferase [Candidatus Protochlamydia phocaeensis]